jgi:hypothetical protein
LRAVFSFVEAPLRDPWRFISAFLCLDDEPSRQVFDALIGMRTRLSIDCAEQAKSPWDEEYFDKAFVRPEQAARFVDAGAAAGDTLHRLEKHLGRSSRLGCRARIAAYYSGSARSPIALKSGCSTWGWTKHPAALSISLN